MLLAATASRMVELSLQAPGSQLTTNALMRPPSPAASCVLSSPRRRSPACPLVYKVHTLTFTRSCLSCCCWRLWGW
eukprot:11412371-Alexandrium_andersonii.AAC.1